MKLSDYLDSTYLKNSKQSGLSDSKTLEKVHALTEEAISNGFFAVMIRPDYVRSVRMLIEEKNAIVKLGTVIDFPEGKGTVTEKISEAQKAIGDGADELDFVVDYTAFKKGNEEKVREEVELCSRLGLKEEKVVKWIIETAALTDDEIAKLSLLIKEIYLEKLSAFPVENIFVKSSTGFFETVDGKPNGANEHVIKIMLENASPLPVKAAGGVKTKAEAEAMISLGVKRIGTSSALQIVLGEEVKNNY
ncbi:deoxyribose-phosphate aldolase [Moheibacter sediminis]|uniref:Deoxyribose-phosphate aldolase n=1 Tax=Moheibacter sediminis TaxID=1434700 RepID=A0A1W2BI23_9FLAO|nr:deoxyribose-phosphate aldolase [Moheibacter sediminis]SMC72583.1 deoxyribose-phosphate aldolase [Moheibacter sediminis]